jgi:hypothetical protein
MRTQDPSSTRLWLVRWMYAVAVGHLVVAVLLPWMARLPLLESYHLGIEQYFWSGAAPVAARAQQVWWISLFAATMQSTALWMLALVHIGNRQRSAAAWVWLLAGLALWAPQDIGFSLQAQVWPHVAVDTFALLIMVPPLLWLWRLDRT